MRKEKIKTIKKAFDAKTGHLMKHLNQKKA